MGFRVWDFVVFGWFAVEGVYTKLLNVDIVIAGLLMTDSKLSSLTATSSGTVGISNHRMASFWPQCPTFPDGPSTQSWGILHFGGGSFWP